LHDCPTCCGRDVTKFVEQQMFETANTESYDVLSYQQCTHWAMHAAGCYTAS